MQPGNILITGASGTIGTALCEKLLESGQNFTGLDREPNKWSKQVQSRTVIGDLLDPSILENLPKDIDFIIHLAANARVYDLVVDPTQAMENIQTTFNILEFARNQEIKQFIFASSREVYGNQPTIPTRVEDSSNIPKPSPVESGNPMPPHPAAAGTKSEQSSAMIAIAQSPPPGAYCFKPIPETQTHLDYIESPYSASKLSGEALVKSYQQCYGLNYIIFRFSNVYGRYDDSTRVIPLFIRHCRQNHTLTVFGQEKILDFTYIEDAVAGILSAITNFKKAQNQTFNLACGQGVSLLEVANLIKSHLSSMSPIEVKPSRTGEVTHYIANTQKAQEILGFEAKVDIKEGIRRAVEWYPKKC